MRLMERIDIPSFYEYFERIHKKVNVISVKKSKEFMFSSTYNWVTLECSGYLRERMRGWGGVF